MCTKYMSPTDRDMEAFYGLKKGNPWRGSAMFPRSEGPFLRAARDVDPDPPLGRELVFGQWALVPWFAKTRKLPYLTVNARSEEISTKASYKHPWARGQRCIIPAVSFEEPNWSSGRNEWWRFKRADGQLFSLAGIWNAWTDPETGEILLSYTMLTINADAHPLMRRFHKPDPKLPPDQQDKRSVVPLELKDVDTWLGGTIEEAHKLVQLAPVEIFEAAPAVEER